MKVFFGENDEENHDNDGNDGNDEYDENDDVNDESEFCFFWWKSMFHAPIDWDCFCRELMMKDDRMMHDDNERVEWDKVDVETGNIYVYIHFINRQDNFVVKRVYKKINIFLFFLFFLLSLALIQLWINIFKNNCLHFNSEYDFHRVHQLTNFQIVQHSLFKFNFVCVFISFIKLHIHYKSRVFNTIKCSTIALGNWKSILLWSSAVHFYSKVSIHFTTT